MLNRRKPRNLFPEPRFQFRFLRFLAVGTLLQMGATAAILYHFISENYLLLVKYAALDEQVINLLNRELRMMVALVAGTFFVYFIAMIFLGISFSHRIAGVIYAIKRTIRDVNEGKDVRLKLRKGDEFQEVQESLNRLIDSALNHRKAAS